MMRRCTPKHRDLAQVCAATVIAVALAACDSRGPTTPTPPTAPPTQPTILPPTVVFSISTIVFDQCTPPIFALSAPRVFSQVTIADEPGGWVGRSLSSATGNAEIHLALGPAGPINPSMTGTMK